MPAQKSRCYHRKRQAHLGYRLYRHAFPDYALPGNQSLRDKLGIPSGERHELCRGLHAEQNVLLQAALYGISLKDSVLYCTNQPCVICAKMLINAGVEEVVIADGYPDKMARDFFKEAGIRVRILKTKR